MSILRDPVHPVPASSVLVVGGFVRDFVMNVPSKDVDIEVYGMDIDTIHSILSAYGFQLDMVGKAFGVIKVDNEIDISVPRRDNKMGIGHKGFAVQTDPNMEPTEAASRRDFTINSLFMHNNGVVLDPFHGMQHIKDKKLVATSEAFIEDPLRVLRGMQFAARFNMQLDPQTAAMCQGMLKDFDTLPRERIWEEWKKFALKGQHAVAGFNALIDSGWMVKFPEIQDMLDVQQDPEWHPEGNVGIHTFLVVQEAINIANRDQLDDDTRLMLFFAALCHDMGKPATTRHEGGRWRAKGHCEAGMGPAMTFLHRIGAPLWLGEHIKPLIMEHLVHAAGSPTDRAVRRLAKRVAPSTIQMLSLLIEADHSGRPPLPKGNPFTAWTDMAKSLNVNSDQPIPILRGRDLIAIGEKPGRQLGIDLENAFQAQLDGEFNDEDSAMRWFIVNVLEKRQ
jgi:tRNA nucleotidyltransferase (CCA-adding enzyme)